MKVNVAVVRAEELKVSQVLALYEAVGWTAYSKDPEVLMAGLSGSHRLVSAHFDGELIGLARAISDGATIAYVQDILVHPDVHRHGVGKALMSTLLAEYASVRQRVLLTDTQDVQRKFYESVGFTEVHDLDPELRAFAQLG